MCVNLVQIGLVVVEIQGVENSNLVVLVVPANNTLVCRMSFLATKT